MAGKHAPASSKSFLISLGASIGGALAALGLVLALVLVALNAGGDNNNQTGSPTISGGPTTRPTSTSTPTARPTTTASPAQSVLPPSRTTTAVLNGTKRNGLAGQFADEARKAGYPVLRTTNAPQDHAKTTIYYRPGAQKEAEAFKRRFPRFTEVRPLPPTYPSDVILTAVLGADWP